MCDFVHGYIVGVLAALCIYSLVLFFANQRQTCFVDSSLDEAIQGKHVVFSNDGTLVIDLNNNEAELMLCDRVPFIPSRFHMKSEGKTYGYLEPVKPNNCIRVKHDRGHKITIDINQKNGLFINNASLVACLPENLFTLPFGQVIGFGITIPTINSETTQKDEL